MLRNVIKRAVVVLIGVLKETVRVKVCIVTKPTHPSAHLCTPCNPEVCPASSSSERTAGSGDPFNNKRNKVKTLFTEEESQINKLWSVSNQFLIFLLKMLEFINSTT